MAFSGALPWATKRVRGVLTCHVNGKECEPCHRGLWWSSLWGHETCKGFAEMGGEIHVNPVPRAFVEAP